MNTPRRITELINRKQDFIDSNRDKLEKTVLKLQSDLLNRLNSEIIPLLDVKDGAILETTNNYRLIGELDKVYNEFTKASSAVVSSQVVNVTDKLVTLGKNYFTVVLTEDLSTRFENIVSATAKKMNLRIGLEGGSMVRGGFLDTFLKDNTVGTQIKNYIGKAVTGQVDMKEFIKGLSTIVSGDDKPGILERQYQRFGFDLYQSYDRAYHSSLADEFGMNYFIYSNGLIRDSRDFCAAHDGRVWSREEANEWTTWTPSKGVYPIGYEVKAKNLYEVPSYMNYVGYQPLIDCGGYNCRHVLAYITDSLAEKMRPDLKKA